MSQAAALRGGWDGARRPPPVPPSVHCVGAQARLRGGPPRTGSPTPTRQAWVGFTQSLLWDLGFLPFILTTSLTMEALQ